jgi:hypothetical protein
VHTREKGGIRRQPLQEDYNDETTSAKAACSLAGDEEGARYKDSYPVTPAVSLSRGVG